MKDLEPRSREIPVTIVGGGLSGLALSKEYKRRGIEHVVFEASPQGKNRSVHYLTSRKSAENLGLSERYAEEVRRREPISGYRLFDGEREGLIPLEAVPPQKETRDGFVTFSISQIRDWLTKEGLPIQRGQAVKRVQPSENNKLLVTTGTGDGYQTNVVIDATGARAKILQLAQIATPDLIGDRLVRYCYGGVFEYGGPEDELFFVDKFPATKGTPQEGGGWIMPLGDNKAEVVVAWEGLLKNSSDWYGPQLPDLLSNYIDWFRGRGVEINPSNKTESVSGVYSQGLLDYRQLPLRPSIIAFGESTGLNHPANGYLINTITRYAEVMGEETERYLTDGVWNPYERLIGESPVNYGLQHSHAKRKMRANISGKGRFTATGGLQNLLVTSLGEDGFWNVIDNGIPLGKLLGSAVKHPKFIGELAKIGTLYARELFTNNHLYLSELGIKLRTALKKRTTK